MLPYSSHSFVFHLRFQRRPCRINEEWKNEITNLWISNKQHCKLWSPPTPTLVNFMPHVGNWREKTERDGFRDGWKTIELKQEKRRIKKGGKIFLSTFPLFITSWGDSRLVPRKESLLFTATSASRLHPSSQPVAGPLARSAADYDRAAWSRQLTAVTRMVPFTLARWTRGTGAGAFPLAPPTICQYADRDWKASGRELRPAVSWSCTADWPVTSFSNSQREKGRNGWRRQGDVCSTFEEEVKLTQTESGAVQRVLTYGDQVLGT